jgi:hypothetical protein
MILIISARRDSHARVVAQEIAKRGVPVAIGDVSEWGAGAKWSMSPHTVDDTRWIGAEGATIQLNSVRSIWCRRVYQPHYDPALRDIADRRFVQRQWNDMLWGTIMSLDAELLSDPFKQRAATKPLQLAVAARVGLTIPETLITNDAQRVREFLSRHDSRVIHKILSASAYERLLYTKCWDEDDERALDELVLAPIILQRRITGTRELRIAIVGDECFAAEFEPGGHVDGRLDSATVYRPHRLPAEIERRLLAMMRVLGLGYATADMRIDAHGDYVFLELNPQGQYLYVEIRTGQPITHALVDLLIANRDKPCSAQKPSNMLAGAATAA